MSAQPRTLTTRLLEPFQSLCSPVFARLFFAQTVSLLGDAFTGIGLGQRLAEIPSETLIGEQIEGR
jgi:hypothetical protein